MSRPTICISPTEFKDDKLIISEHKEIKTKNDFKTKISEIYYINDQNEPCDLYISLPTVKTYGPFPQYNFNATSKALKDICGYTISYSNEETNKLFQSIQNIISKKFKKCNIKPVFTKNKNDKETAYLKVKMNGENISTRFYSDKKCTKTIDGLDIVSKYGELTPMIHLRSIYFGSHGTSDYNSSLQISIAKAIFQEKKNITPEFNFDDSDNEEFED